MIKHLRKRDGFSLLELLVVISIIAILVALSMAAIMRIRIAQQVRSSSDVVEKVQLAVDNQYKAIIAQALKDLNNGQPNSNVLDAQAIFNICGGDTDRALALLTYCRIRQYFPQTFAEAQTPFSLSSGGFTANFPVKSQFLQFATVSTAAGSVDQQSAALLYVAVSQTGSGGSTFASDDATTSSQVSFPFGTSSFMVYKDAWQQPVGFCRFGQNTELQGAPYANTKKAPLLDPLDPAGKLMNWTNTTVLNQAVAGVFLNNGDLANATLFNGTNRRPVVYSIGLNKVYESLDNSPSLVTGSLPKDDILGYRLTQLGQRGTQ